MMHVVGTSAELAEALVGDSQRAVVMTMGALHDGHAQLIRQARELVGVTGEVVVTVFVNPTQFGAGEDFDRYPRTFDDDVRICDASGADAVLAPTAAEVYGPSGAFTESSITVDPGLLGGLLEGAARPTHFRGVLTVVAKLMGMTRPHLALFGEKDYQQLTLIRRMASDLNLGVEIVGVPTVREGDGLALSSRNRYLSSEEREAAVVVPRALEAVVSAAAAGDAEPLDAGRAVLADVPQFDVDYLVLTDPELGPAPVSGDARVLIAGRLGPTRLLDNMPVRMGAR